MEVVVKKGEKVLSLGKEFEKTVTRTLKEIEVIKARSVELSALQKEQYRIEQILNGLKNTWKVQDPGKYFLACWFLQRGRKVYVQELLPDGVKPFEGGRREYYQYKSSLNQPFRGAHDPVWLDPDETVVSMKDVDITFCPDCGKEQPIIRTYQQTYDSYEGDEWTSQFIFVCCGKIHLLDQKVSDMRFA